MRLKLTLALTSMLIVGGSLTALAVIGEGSDSDVPQVLEDAKAARIELANEAYSELRSEAPESKARLLLSLQTPVAAEELVSVASESDVELLYLNTWLLAPGSAFPKTGMWSMDYLGGAKATGVDVQSTIDAATLQYLAEREAEITRLGDLGEISPEAAEAQIREVTSLRIAVKEDGVQLYGFSCVCSPETLESVTDRLSLQVQAIEVPAKTGIDQPVFPTT
jgi:hypothetical protein